MTELLGVTTHDDDLRIGDTDRLTLNEVASELASNDDALRALAAEKLMLQNQLAKNENTAAFLARRREALLRAQQLMLDNQLLFQYTNHVTHC